MDTFCDGKIMKPDFRRMTDADLIGLLGWCEDWSPQEVYETAFAQVFPKKQLKEAKVEFEKWIQFENPQLPVIVREELVRASTMHFEKGSMNMLVWYSRAARIFNKSIWLFYIFAAIVIAKWLL